MRQRFRRSFGAQLQLGRADRNVVGRCKTFDVQQVNHGDTRFVHPKQQAASLVRDIGNPPEQPVADCGRFLDPTKRRDAAADIDVSLGFATRRVEGPTPLSVCHINGVEEVLSVTVRGSTAYSYVTTRGEFGIPDSYTTTICSIPAGRSITYTSGGLNDEAYTLYSFSEASAVAGAEFDDTADGGGRGVVKAYADHTMTWALSGAPSIDNVACAYWGAYARDAFIKFRPVSTFKETYSGHSLEGWPGENAYYLDGVISGDMIALVGDYSGVSTVSVPHSVHTENVKGAVIVPGHGEPIDVYNDAIMRSYWWFYLTYSAFGSSSQQLSLNADGFHRHVGDLLNTESPENPMKEYTFIGYT